MAVSNQKALATLVTAHTGILVLFSLHYVIKQLIVDMKNVIELNCRYAIMWECWQQDPESRPTFLELGKTLHRLMTAQKVSITKARKRYKMNRFD